MILCLYHAPVFYTNYKRKKITANWNAMLLITSIVRHILILELSNVKHTCLKNQ